MRNPSQSTNSYVQGSNPLSHHFGQVPDADSSINNLKSPLRNYQTYSLSEAKSPNIRNFEYMQHNNNNDNKTGKILDILYKGTEKSPDITSPAWWRNVVISIMMITMRI